MCGQWHAAGLAGSGAHEGSSGSLQRPRDGPDGAARPGSACTPGRVLTREPDDQGDKFGGDRRPSGPGQGLPPLPPHQAPVPAQYRARRDEPAPAQLWGQQPDQRGEHRPVRPGQSRRTAGTAKHGDLVAQHQDLDVLRRRRARKQHQPCRETREYEIQQSDRHGQTGSHTSPTNVVSLTTHTATSERTGQPAWQRF